MSMVEMIGFSIRRISYFFQRRMLTEYAGNVYWKLPESTVMVLDFGAMFSGIS